MNNLIGRYAKMRPFLMGRTHFGVDSNSNIGNYLPMNSSVVPACGGLMNYLVMTVGVRLLQPGSRSIPERLFEVVGAEARKSRP